MFAMYLSRRIGNQPTVADKPNSLQHATTTNFGNSVKTNVNPKDKVNQGTKRESVLTTLNCSSRVLTYLIFMKATLLTSFVPSPFGRARYLACRLSFHSPNKLQRPGPPPLEGFAW